jgi:putative transposase
MTSSNHITAEVQLKVVKDVELQVQRTKMTVSRVLKMYGISRSTFYGWTDEVAIPKKRRNLFAILPEEEEAVLQYRKNHREIGYRKLTWEMNDKEVSALSESMVYQVLKKHDLLGPVQVTGSPATKEYQHKPSKVHEHWHIDIAYIKIKGVFYFLVMMLDGYSRYILGWDLMSDMLGSSVEDFVVRVREMYPNCSPKLINDNGSQFISRDFKVLLSRLEIQQVFTRRNHPQTNGKIERLNGTIKQEAIRPDAPSSYDEAYNTIDRYVRYYNSHRLHASINYLRPEDLFLGREQTILNQRKQRLHQARIARLITNKLKFQEENTHFLQN